MILQTRHHTMCVRKVSQTLILHFRYIYANFRCSYINFGSFCIFVLIFLKRKKLKFTLFACLVHSWWRTPDWGSWIPFRLLRTYSKISCIFMHLQGSLAKDSDLQHFGFIFLPSGDKLWNINLETLILSRVYLILHQNSTYCSQDNIVWQILRKF